MRQIGLVGRRLVIAGGGIRGRKDESSCAGPSCRFENPERLGDVDLERAERIAHGIRDPGAGGEMDDRIDTGHGFGDGGPIGQRGANQLMRHPGEVGQPADRQVVENPDPIAPFDQEPDER